MNPEIFARNSNGIWQFICYADRKDTAKTVNSNAASSTGVAAARAMFANKVTKGISTNTGSSSSSNSSSGPEDVWTKHQNAITYLKPFGNASKYRNYSRVVRLSNE